MWGHVNWSSYFQQLEVSSLDYVSAVPVATILWLLNSATLILWLLNWQLYNGFLNFESDSLTVKPRPLLLACLESILGLFGSALGPGWFIMSKSTGNWLTSTGSTHAICICNKQGTAKGLEKDFYHSSSEQQQMTKNNLYFKFTLLTMLWFRPFSFTWKKIMLLRSTLNSL